MFSGSCNLSSEKVSGAFTAVILVIKSALNTILIVIHFICHSGKLFCRYNYINLHQAMNSYLNTLTGQRI